MPLRERERKWCAAFCGRMNGWIDGRCVALKGFYEKKMAGI